MKTVSKKAAWVGFAMMFAVGFGVSATRSAQAAGAPMAAVNPPALTCSRCIQICDTCIPDPAQAGNCICN
ncbi:MAG: hypothetical protein JWN44_771 [Myxococcales bacterium]|nr:hypothetical protein [Myxococcales bacterium]